MLRNMASILNDQIKLPIQTLNNLTHPLPISLIGLNIGNVLVCRPVRKRSEDINPNNLGLWKFLSKPPNGITMKDTIFKDIGDCPQL